MKTVVRKPTAEQLKKHGKLIKRDSDGLAELWNYKGVEYCFYPASERIESRLYQRRMYGNKGCSFPYKFKRWY
jgi:hypothetical protein